MEIIEKISRLTDKDSFLVTVSIKNGNDVETQCVTNNFPYGDIPVATDSINSNIQKLAVQVAPPVPAALRPENLPELNNDMVTYAEGEE